MKYLVQIFYLHKTQIVQLTLPLAILEIYSAEIYRVLLCLTKILFSCSAGSSIWSYIL